MRYIFTLLWIDGISALHDTNDWEKFCSLHEGVLYLIDTNEIVTFTTILQEYLFFSNVLKKNVNKCHKDQVNACSKLTIQKLIVNNKYARPTSTNNVLISLLLHWTY